MMAVFLKKGIKENDMNILAIQNKPFVNFTSIAAPAAQKSVDRSAENYSIMVDGQKYLLQSGSMLSDVSKVNNLEDTHHFIAIA